MARINFTIPDIDLDTIDNFLSSEHDLPATTRSAFLRYCALRYIREWRQYHAKDVFI